MRRLTVQAPIYIQTITKSTNIYMSSPKQMMDFKPVKSVDANVSNEHQHNWSNELFERKAKNPDHNYDRSRTALNFQVGPGGRITVVDKSQRIGDRVEEIIKKHLRPDLLVY